MIRARLHRRWPATAVAVAAAVAVVWAPLPAMASTAAQRAGTAGTDVPVRTDSAVTVSGRGSFANLKITVGQTRSLAHQALSVTWNGGAPTNDGIFFDTNFLQIFQCWGDDDGTNHDNPGPPPEQCQFGAYPLVGTVGKLPVAQVSDNFQRVIATTDAEGRMPVDRSQGFFEPAAGQRDPRVGQLWKPFRAVDGTVVNVQTKTVAAIQNGSGSAVTQEWQNTFFDYVTTNEIRYGRTYSDRTGSELFEADTGEEARGLGCGQKVQPRPDGTKTIPRCWLVVVPRNGGLENLPDRNASVVKSPLTPGVWANRIAVPLEFNPRDSTCAIGADERRIVGSELSTAAVTNWQPSLCSKPGSPPYAYAGQSDDLARRQLLSGTSGAPGMAVVSLPADPAVVDASNPITYAPFTLSGAVIGFNIERRANVEKGNEVTDAQKPIAGTRVGRMNLTPRLVAKLLTQSYKSEFRGLDPGASDYGWLKNNPATLADDPDFIQYNPEFQDLSFGEKLTGGSLVVEAPTSDTALVVWAWVLSDREAAIWLAGITDASGMAVNPRYNIDPARNPSGVSFAGSQPLNTFPKSDPYCLQSPALTPETPPQHPRPLCMPDFHPYAGSMEAAAQETRTANQAAKTTHTEGDPTQLTASTWYGADGPEVQGGRSILSVTDSASSARYGLQTASLSRAGDDTSARSFVAPDQAGLLAGAQAMVPSGVKGVLKPDPVASAPGGYPLAMLTYAAVAPAHLDAKARTEYAAVVDYAAGPGQTPGFATGDLPVGYAPLPAALRAQATAAAKAIRDWAAPGAPPPPGAATQPGSTDQSGTVDVGGRSAGGGSPPGGGSGSPSAAGLPTPSPTPSTDPGGPAALARALTRTAAVTVGFIRYTLPIIAAVGLLAALGAFLLTARRRRLGRGAPKSVGRTVPTARS